MPLTPVGGTPEMIATPCRAQITLRDSRALQAPVQSLFPLISTGGALGPAIPEALELDIKNRVSRRNRDCNIKAETTRAYRFIYKGMELKRRKIARTCLGLFLLSQPSSE